VESRISEKRYLTYKEYVTHDEARPRIWCLSPSGAGYLGRSAAVRDHDAAFPLTTSDVRSYDRKQSPISESFLSISASDCCVWRYRCGCFRVLPDIGGCRDNPGVALSTLPIYRRSASGSTFVSHVKGFKLNTISHISVSIRIIWNGNSMRPYLFKDKRMTVFIHRSGWRINPGTEKQA
jgi:hypothetical protein